MCELFRCNEEKLKICITYNVSSEGITIWAGYNKEDYWDVRRGEQIVYCLIKSFKLDKIGYKDRPRVSKYKSPFWELHALTCKYYIHCVKFDSEVFFTICHFGNMIRHMLIFNFCKYIFLITKLLILL